MVNHWENRAGQDQGDRNTCSLRVQGGKSDTILRPVRDDHKSCYHRHVLHKSRNLTAGKAIFARLQRRHFIKRLTTQGLRHRRWEKETYPRPRHFYTHGFSWHAIRQISDEVLQQIPDGQPLPSVKLKNLNYQHHK